MNFQKLNITDLHPAEYNPRMTANIRKSNAALRKVGYVDPVIVNTDMTVIGGHQRVKVLKDLGYDVVLDIDKDQEKNLNIALNKICLCRTTPRGATRNCTFL